MEKFSFEAAMVRLEAIVKDLENGKATLDSSLTLFEEGIRLVKLCDQQLKEVEEKSVKILQGGSLENFSIEE